MNTTETGGSYPLLLLLFSRDWSILAVGPKKNEFRIRKLDRWSPVRSNEHPFL